MICQVYYCQKIRVAGARSTPSLSEKCEKCGKPKMSTVPDPAMTCYLVWHFCFCEEMANDAPKNEGPLCDNCSKPSRYHFCWQDDSHKYHPSELRRGSTPSPYPPPCLKCGDTLATVQHGNKQGLICMSCRDGELSRCLRIDHMHTPEQGCWELRPTSERLSERAALAPSLPTKGEK